MTGTEPIRVLFCENNVDGTVGGSYFSLLYLVKGLGSRALCADRGLLHRPPAGAGFPRRRRRDATSGCAAGRSRSALARPRGRGCVRPQLVLRKALNYLRGFVGPALFRAWFLATRNVSIVHLNNSVLYNHDWMLAARLAGKRVPDARAGHQRRGTPRPPSSSVSGSTPIVCISEAVRQNMRDRGADFGNLVTIHNGLDPAEMRPTIDAAALRARLRS